MYLGRLNVSCHRMCDKQTPLLLVKFASDQIAVKAFRDQKVFQIPDVVNLQLCHHSVVRNFLHKKTLFFIFREDRPVL